MCPREIYSIKLKRSEESENKTQPPVFISYVKGDELGVDQFAKLVYGDLSKEVQIKKLSVNGKYVFPWQISKPIVDLDLVFGNHNSRFYLVKSSSGEFFMGSYKHLRNFPILDNSSMKVELEPSEIELLKSKRYGSNSICKDWYVFPGDKKFYKRVKKFWNKKVTVK